MPIVFVMDSFFLKSASSFAFGSSLVGSAVSFFASALFSFFAAGGAFSAGLGAAESVFVSSASAVAANQAEIRMARGVNQVSGSFVLFTAAVVLSAC